MSELPRWATEMRDLFRSGSAAQFLIHGNVFDVIPHGGRLLSLPAFLDEVMFSSYDVVLRYDRSRGVRATRGGEDWGAWLDDALGQQANLQSLLREPGSALELIDRYLLRTLNLQALAASQAAGRLPSTSLGPGKPASTPSPEPRVPSPEPAAPIPHPASRVPAAKRIAVVVEFAEFVVPRGDALQLGGPFAANTVKVLGWANDPAIVQSNIVTVLLSEALHDLERSGGRQSACRGAARAAAERGRDDRLRANAGDDAVP